MCTGALLVTLSALYGAAIYRIPRNDIYITHMLRLLRFFYTQYCLTRTPPPPNFNGMFPDMRYVCVYTIWMYIVAYTYIHSLDYYYAPFLILAP